MDIMSLFSERPNGYRLSLTHAYIPIAQSRSAADSQVIVGHQEPQEDFQAIAKMEIMPFRDAGNGDMDHGLYIQVRDGEVSSPRADR